MIKKCNISSKITKKIDKFFELYEGPYVISRISSPSTYEVVDPKTNVIKGIYHISKIFEFKQ